MENWRRQYLGLDRMPADLSDTEIVWFFRPDEQCEREVQARRQAITRFGLILHMGFLRMTGRPLAQLDRLPAKILAFAAEHAGMVAPQIATLRAIYRRRPTLFEHQRIAAKTLGFSAIDEHRLRGLTAYMRRQAGSQIDRDGLILDARVWLYTRGYLLPGRRALAEMAAAAQGYCLTALKDTIMRSVGAVMSDSWVSELTPSAPVNAGANVGSVFDWLRSASSGFGTRDMDDVRNRIDELRRLGAQRIDLPDLSIERVRQHARRIARRKASTLSRLREPRRTVEIGCWLRLQLLTLTDMVLEQAKRRIGQLWNQARRSVEARAAEELLRYQVATGRVVAALDDASMSAEDFRVFAATALRPLAPNRISISRASLIRDEMTSEPGQLRRLLKLLDSLNLDIARGHPLDLALGTLRQAYAKGGVMLDPHESLPFAPAASLPIMRSSSENKRLAAFEVATAMLLKRSLANGDLSASHSIDHRAPADQLIPPSRWAHVQSETVRRHDWAPSVDAWLSRIKPLLASRVELLDEAISDGKLEIVDEHIRLPRIRAIQEESSVDEARKKFFDAMAGAQLSDIILEVDGLTRFSSLLIGRPPRNRDELTSIYAGLVALGTEKTASQMARMLDGVSDDRVEFAMRNIEEAGGLREANNAVAKAMLALPIAHYWGPGTGASADMMSLDATRHLWMARIEPRRRSHAVGTYTHVADRWALIYDQPIILNKRQAGAALEGALGQKLIDLQHLAVDTHGFTHFAMAMAKLLGFDLCPRLAGLSRRQLYLPKGLAVPARIEPIVKRISFGRQTRDGWDGLLRVAASLKEGFGSVATILDRNGSAARGSPVFEAGTAVGKVLRSLFLLDYLGNPVFRRELHRSLSQGESVHQLQRALLAGSIGAKHGRTIAEIGAISGALTLLTNIVMMWNTHEMQKRLDAAGDDRPSAADLKHIAPVAYRHINMQGIMRFDTLARGPMAAQNIQKAG